MGRGPSATHLASRITRKTDAATYGTSGLTESFHGVSGGIEQSFHVEHRTPGSGELTITVPVSGLTAATSDQTPNTIDLDDHSGQVAAIYDDLKVTDAHGRDVSATMRASTDGSEIIISVQDAHAAYPLTIDPTWSQLSDLLYSASTQQVQADNVATGTLGTAIRGGNEWLQMATTPDGQFGYAVDYNEQDVTPINLVTGAKGTSINVGYYPLSVVMAPNGQTVYSVTNSFFCPINVATNTKGTCLDLATYGDRGGSMAISPDGRTAYIFSDTGTALLPINLATDTLGTPITWSTGFAPATDGIAISPNGQVAYLVGGSNSVLPINLVTQSAETPITWPSGAGPESVAFTPNGQTAYVVNGGNDTITPVTVATNTPGTPISVSSLPDPGYANGPDGGPTAIAIAPSGQMAYFGTDYGYAFPLNLTTDAIGSLINFNYGGEGTISLYMISPLTVTPQGIALAADTLGGGSKSEGCQTSWSHTSRTSTISP